MDLPLEFAERVYAGSLEKFIVESFGEIYYDVNAQLDNEASERSGTILPLCFDITHTPYDMKERVIL
jgi:hypothetical protein